MRRTPISLLAFACAASALLPQSLPSDVPDELKPPADAHLVLQAHAKGVQIYGCQVGSDQKLAWILKGPEAELFNEKGESIGKHSAGPAWELSDGSGVTGKVVAKKDAPGGTAIPWLLLSVTGRSGSGGLSGVSAIQRLHTVGGLPPDSKSCDEPRRGQETRSSYSADYYFYAATPQH
ncbi:MAG TPA: DUF3455 domain-containing protein [Dongiaceae bacterium]|nr:DUF3455 domain-containing protein [Dongiaceae bacterium]